MSVTTHPAVLKLGFSRLFGSCDLGVSGLVSGWANPEETHLWNDGPDARLDLEILAPIGDFVIEFAGGPFISPNSQKQPVTLYVNGYRVGYWLLHDDRTVSLYAPVSREQIIVRSERLILQCIWHLPASSSPASNGQGEDGRELGFCFQSIRIDSE